MKLKKQPIGLPSRNEGAPSSRPSNDYPTLGNNNKRFCEKEDVEDPKEDSEEAQYEFKSKQEDKLVYTKQSSVTAAQVSILNDKETNVTSVVEENKSCEVINLDEDSWNNKSSMEDSPKQVSKSVSHSAKEMNKCIFEGDFYIDLESSEWFDITTDTIEKIPGLPLTPEGIPIIDITRTSDEYDIIQAVLEIGTES